jgi:3-methyladenine DNA glycosylase AlkD
MDEIERVAAEIDERLRALPSRFTEPLRALRQQLSREIKERPAQEVVHLALALLRYPTLQHRFLAYELVHYHRPALASLGAAELERLGQGMNNWAAVDTFASYLSGPAWREGQVSDEVIHRWAASPDRWWRRAALVSTVPLNTRARGGRGDVARTLAVCRLLAADRDDMVVKGLSWALRELAFWDEAAVNQFLEAYEMVLAARVKREVRNKLETGLKNPRRDA